MTEKRKPMKKSGFCAFPGTDGHGHSLCIGLKCNCTCHKENA